MPGLYSNTARNAAVDAIAALADFASLHIAFPGEAGASEVVGGSPAHARKAIAWNPSVAGSAANSSSPVFDVPGSTTLAWLGFWTLVTGGSFLGCSPLGGGVPFPFTADDATDTLFSDGHGFLDGQQVVVIDTQQATVPGGLVEGTIYFVRDATTDTFKLAATSGGVAINLTADGAGFVTTIAPEVYASQGTFTAQSAFLTFQA